MNCPICLSQLIEHRETTEHIQMQGELCVIDRYKSCKCNVCKCVFTTADQYEANWRQARKEAA